MIGEMFISDFTIILLAFAAGCCAVTVAIGLAQRAAERASNRRLERGFKAGMRHLTQDQIDHKTER